MNIQTNQPIEGNGEALPFLGVFTTGYGADFTLAVTKSNGQPNSRPDAGSPYPHTGLQEIVSMVTKPLSVPKERGQWIIMSSYNQCDARVFVKQRENGKFWALGADVDKGNATLEHVVLATRAVLGNVFFLVWATPSSQPAAQRWRILAPVAEPLAPSGFTACQTVFFNELLKYSIQCDHTLAREAQLLYLPNAGQHYAYHIQPGPLFDVRSWQYIEKARRHVAANAPPPSAHKPRDPNSALGIVCRSFDLEAVMIAAGYEPQSATSDQYATPGGTKGNFGVKVYREDGRWTSRHETDMHRFRDNRPRGDVVDILRAFHGWQPEDAVRVGHAIKNGFNPKGIPYHAVPAEVDNWQRNMTLTMTEDGKISFSF